MPLLQTRDHRIRTGFNARRKIALPEQWQHRSIDNLLTDFMGQCCLKSITDGDANFPFIRSDEKHYPVIVPFTSDAPAIR